MKKELFFLFLMLSGCHKQITDPGPIAKKKISYGLTVRDNINHNPIEDILVRIIKQNQATYNWEDLEKSTNELGYVFWDSIDFVYNKNPPETTYYQVEIDSTNAYTSTSMEIMAASDITNLEDAVYLIPKQE